LLDHRNRYSLQELKLLVESSSSFLGVDAGPLHIAAATKIPMVVFFTSAHHALRKPFRPVGSFHPIQPAIECYGCQISNPPPGTDYFCRRGDNQCVNSFDAGAVAMTVMSALSEPGLTSK
jgi:ADP-heptose:LPS heptosyltransferase